MKTCQVCGALVDDKEIACPECGATVVKHVDGFALKNEAPVKKKSNPMGTTLSTGSGLTDILRAENDDFDAGDDDFMGGSIPVALARTEIDGDFSAKKKTHIGKTLFKIILLCAVAYGAYLLVVNVFMKKEGATEYAQVIDIYVDAINNTDKDRMMEIVPPYILDDLDTAEMILDEMGHLHIDDYSIVSVTNYATEDIESLQAYIKLQSGRTANISEACFVKVRLQATGANASGAKVQNNIELEVELVKIKEKWYLLSDTYDNPFKESR